MIRLDFPGVPPTINSAYENVTRRRLPNGQVIGGGRRLTEEGRAYLVTTRARLAQTFMKELKSLKKNTPYLVCTRFVFDRLENKGYPASTGNRYKKLDVTNRVKLLEDALKDAGGFDDSQTLTFICQKVLGPQEHTFLWVWDLEEEESPFDGPLRTL